MPHRGSSDPSQHPNAAVCVIGGANVDIKSQTYATPVARTSNPGFVRRSAGGVGRNIAENLSRMGVTTALISAFGSDLDGKWLMDETADSGVDLSHCVVSSRPTGRYTAVLDEQGEMVIAVAAMDVIEEVTVRVIEDAARQISRAALLVLDSNLSEAAMLCAAAISRDASVPVVVDPVSVPKANRVRALLSAGIRLHTVTPNLGELAALSGMTVATDREVAAAAASLHRDGVDHVWVRLGSVGSYLSVASPTGVRGDAVGLHSSPLVDATGAGDAMLAGYAAALVRGIDPVAAARYGSAAAAVTIESAQTVSPTMTFEELAKRVGAT